MVNTSEKYNKSIYKSNRKFNVKAKITLADKTILNISNEDIMQGGVIIEDGVSSPNSFEIGGSVIGELTLVLNNLDDKFSTYDFYGATIYIQIGLFLPDDTVEFIPKGYYTVDDALAESSTITLTALDNMSKFDKPYSKSTLKYPATLADILRDACLCCGVSLFTQTFLNADYIVNSRPDDEKTTFREVVSWIAQLAGSFAKINYNGEFTLNWYDYSCFDFNDYLDGGNFIDYSSGDTANGGNFIDYSSGDIYTGGVFKFTLPPIYINKIKSCKIATDDITITGVKIVPVDDKTPTYISGEEGYVISVEDNPLAQDNIEALTYSIGKQLNGFTFRPYTAESLSNPAAEAGDVALIIDRKGNRYKSIVSNLSFKIGDFESFSGDYETPSKKESSRYSASAKAVQAAKQETEKQISNYDLAVQQLNNLMANAMGVFETVEKQDDGSIICYAHDKPTISESKIIWKKSRDAFAVSFDGGLTWHGMTAEGNIVAQVLTVIGINADWINAGSVKAENISQEYKKDVTDEINNSASEVTQAFKAADGQVLSTVNNTLSNYSTTAQMNSAITQSANTIASEVSSTYLSKASASNTYATKTSLTQTANEINLEVSKKVNDSDFGTKITQNYSSVQIAWNTISQIIQFANAALNIYDSSGSNKKLLMKLSSSGQHFYRDGIYVGKIGTNKWGKDNSKKGLVFDLDDGHYMAWANNEGTSYITKFSYYNTSSLNPIGLHLGDNFYLNGYNVYISDNEIIKRWSNGGGIQTSNCFQIVNSNNSAIAKFIYPNWIDFYGELNMHNYVVRNTSIENSSDVRLKKDIADSQVNALNIINNIDCKEFIWKDDNRFEELGFIAQQVGHVNKKFIGEEKREDETYYTVNQLAMIPYLVKAIQELSAKIDGLTSAKSSTKLEVNKLKNTYSADDKFDLSGIKKSPETSACESENPTETGFRDLENGEVEFFTRNKKPMNG